MSKDEFSEFFPEEEELMEYENIDDDELDRWLDACNEVFEGDCDESEKDFDPDTYATAIPVMSHDDEDEGIAELRKDIHMMSDGSVWFEDKEIKEAAYESMRSILRFLKEKDSEKYNFRLFGNTGFSLEDIWFRIIFPQDTFTMNDLKTIASFIPDNTKVDIHSFYGEIFIDLFYLDIRKYMGQQM